MWPHYAGRRGHLSLTPHTVGAASPSTRTRMRNANTSILHPSRSLWTHQITSSSSSGELHLYIESATATSDIWNNHSHSDTHITTITPVYEYFLLGWWSRYSGTIKPFRAWNGYPKLGILWKDPWILTTLPTTGVPTTSNAHTLSTTTTCTFTTGPTNPPLRPETLLFHNHPPTFDRHRRTITHSPTIHSEDAREPQHMKCILCPHLTIALLDRLQAPPLPRRPHPSCSCGKGNHFAPTQVITHRAPGLNFRFQKFTNPLGIDTVYGVHATERINCTSTPPQHNLKPAPALLDNWRMNMSKKVEIETSH